VSALQFDETPRQSVPGRHLIEADGVILRLEEAGRTLLALPSTGYSTRLSAGGLDFVREAIEAYGWTDAPVKPAAPAPAAIGRMDEAHAWVSQYIPDNQRVLRRIIGARSLVHPITDRHLFGWTKIAAMLHTDHKAIQRWHADGIRLITARLQAKKYFQ
jgi:hypothetical protein